MLPQQPHAAAASVGAFEAGTAHEKGRVTVPVGSGSPYALANVTGSPRAQSARRTVGAYRGRGESGQGVDDLEN